MKITNLKKKLGAFQLDIDDLELENGCIHGFIGANGSGKTTLAKLIMGIMEQDSGEISYNGLSPREITMTSQRPYMLHSSVYENLIYPLKLRGIKPQQDEIDALLEKHNLLDKKKQYARSLSSGEQQKLSFLRTMIFKPKLVIIDESLSNLDSDSLELFENWILENQKTDQITWVIISHQLPHINTLCDKVHFFSQGKVIESGLKDNVIFNSDNPLIKTFVKKQALEITR